MMNYCVLPKCKTAYIFDSQKQMIAAAKWIQGIDHAAVFMHTHERLETVAAMLTRVGYDIQRAKKTDAKYLFCDFVLPVPGAPYLLREFCY